MGLGLVIKSLILAGLFSVGISLASQTNYSANHGITVSTAAKEQEATVNTSAKTQTDLTAKNHGLTVSALAKTHGTTVKAVAK